MFFFNQINSNEMPGKNEMKESPLTRRRKTYCIGSNYFGETLKELRLEKGFSQVEAANLIKVSQGQWSSYEKGNSRPNLDTIISIAMAFKTNPLVILGKSLDKSKLLDPLQELSFSDYQIIADDHIENYRKNKLKQRFKQFV